MNRKTWLSLSPSQRLMRIAPSFIVTRGVVYVDLGGRTWVVHKEWPLSYQKHGTIFLRYAEDSWAVLANKTLNGKEVVVFIPPEKRMFISNGNFAAVEVNYPSFVQVHDAGTLASPMRRRRII